MNPIPDSAYVLIEELELMYPARCKDPEESLEQHMQLSGQVDLIARLRQRLDWTRENSIIGD